MLFPIKIGMYNNKDALIFYILVVTTDLAEQPMCSYWSSPESLDRSECAIY